MDERTYIRKVCSRTGVAMIACMLASMGAGTVFSVALQLLAPELLNNTVGVLLLNDALTYGLGGLLLWLILRGLPVGALPSRGITPKRGLWLALESVGLMAVFNLLTVGIVTAVQLMSGKETSNLLDSMTDSLPMGWMFFFMVIVAPICEEIMMRWILFRRLLPVGGNFAVFASALCFALFHSNLYQFFYAFALGAFFGFVMLKTGRLRYTIGLHMLINFIGSVVVLAVGDSVALSVIYTVALYGAAIAGLVLLVREWRTYRADYPDRQGCWAVAFSSPGFLTFVILFGLLSVAVPFLPGM